MNDNVIRQIQKESAEALLDAGLSVPLKGIRLPFRKRPLVFRVTMKRTCLAVQMRIARLYLDMGVTADGMEKFTKEDEMRFLSEHGKAVSLMVAHTLCRFTPLVGLAAWYVRHRMEHKYLLHAFPDVHPADGDQIFYTYYQIGGAEQSDEAEAEPSREGELRTRYEPSHSPFGFVWQVASATGWSVEYILHKVNYQTLVMMLSDAPRYVRCSKRDDAIPGDPGKSAEAEAKEIEGFFQSRL